MKKGWRKLKKKKSVGRKRNETKQSNRYFIHPAGYHSSDYKLDQNSSINCIFGQVYCGAALKSPPGIGVPDGQTKNYEQVNCNRKEKGVQDVYSR